MTDNQHQAYGQIIVEQVDDHFLVRIRDGLDGYEQAFDHIEDARQFVASVYQGTGHATLIEDRIAAAEQASQRAIDSKYPIKAKWGLYS